MNSVVDEITVLLDRIEDRYRAELVFTRLKVPADERPGGSAPLADYKTELVRWADRQDGRQCKLRDALRVVVGALPTDSSDATTSQPPVSATEVVSSDPGAREERVLMVLLTPTRRDGARHRVTVGLWHGTNHERNLLAKNKSVARKELGGLLENLKPEDLATLMDFLPRCMVEFCVSGADLDEPFDAWTFGGIPLRERHPTILRCIGRWPHTIGWDLWTENWREICASTGSFLTDNMEWIGCSEDCKESALRRRAMQRHHDRGQLVTFAFGFSPFEEKTPTTDVLACLIRTGVPVCLWVRAVPSSKKTGSTESPAPEVRAENVRSALNALPQPDSVRDLPYQLMRWKLDEEDENAVVHRLVLMWEHPGRTIPLDRKYAHPM